MKKSIQRLLTISLCIGANVSIAMELEKSNKQINNITEITCIKSPQYAQYLYNGHVVISGEDGCSIIDPKTNKEISKISSIKHQKLAIHPNKKLFALTHENQVEIYDVEKNDYIWTKIVEGSYEHSENPYDKVKQLCFNPHDTTIFVIRANYRNSVEGNSGRYSPNDYRMTEYNYTTHQDGIHNFNYGYNARSPLIALSPTQKEMWTVHPGWTTCHPTDSEFSGQNSRVYCSYGKHYKEFCEYSPDGSYIIQGDSQNSIYIINTNDPKEYTGLQHKDTNLYQREDFKKMQFYSNSVLAIASALRIFSQEKDVTKKHTIASHTLLSYFDIHTQTIIHVSQPLDPSTTYDFSFFPGKTHAIIALKDGCVILPVHFDVMYKDITKDKFLYFMFLLKNIKQKSDSAQLLPEVNQLIAQKLLELHKRD